MSEKSKEAALNALHPKHRARHEGLVQFLPKENLQKVAKMGPDEAHKELERIRPIAVKHQGLRTCDDCGTVTYFDAKKKKGNTFMTKNHIWDKHVGDKHTILCPSCLETRMGRKLRRGDLDPSKQLNHDTNFLGLKENFEKKIDNIFK